MNWWIKKRSASKAGKKALWLEDIRNQMASIPKLIDNTLQQELQLTDSQVTVCFANAKFLVIDEMTNSEYLMYLKYDEFLEYIVRLADMANFSEGATQGFKGWATPPESDEDKDEKSDQDGVAEPEGLSKPPPR
jgi:hypothetical protein